MLDDELYVWIMKELLNEGEISVADIKSKYGTDSDEVVFGEEFLNRYANNNIVRQESTEFELLDSVELRERYRELTEREPIEVDQIGHNPVVSIPSSMRSDWHQTVPEPEDTVVFTLQEALSTTISQGESIVRLSVPYFEISGFNILESEFLELAERGATLQVLTREVLDPPRDDYGHNKKRKAINELVDRYETAAADGAEIEVRDFYRSFGEDHPKLDRSVHAKLAVADRSIAYVGSGEIRDNSMNLNAEAGYIVGKESHATFWADSFDFIWENATEVTGDDMSTWS